MKNVIEWEPKRDIDPKKPGNFVGRMRTKVLATTPMAVNHSGVLANGRSFNYWGFDVESVSGVLRWVDKIDNGDYGTSIVLYLETEKRLHKISMPYAYNVRAVMNGLCGMNESITTSVISISYYVVRALHPDGTGKTDKNGENIWNRYIVMGGEAKKQFTAEQWKDFSQTNGLDSIKTRRADGTNETNFDNELRYWDSRLVEIQRYLMKSGTALPFCYNSWTAIKGIQNPSGGGNLTDDECDQAKEIWERVRGEYKFAYQKERQGADDALDAMESENRGQLIDYFERPKPLPHPDTVLGRNDDGFPSEEPPIDHTVGAKGDDLPF